MRRMIRNSALMFLSVFVLLFGGCRTKEENVIKDIKQYLQVNSDVSKELEDCFCGFLPESNVIEQDSAEYYYAYQNPALGNSSFVIYLKTEIKDSTKWLTEKERILSLSDQVVYNDGQLVLCFAGDLDNAIKAYTDDEVLDGLHIKFEIAIIDEQTETIEYLVASQRDGNKRSETILQVLEKVNDLQNNETILS